MSSSIKFMDKCGKEQYQELNMVENTKSLKTILKEGYFLLEEKRSSFIARAKPVSSEQEAIDFIQQIKASHRDATHNCYAYSVDADALYQRYSDDGEPQGTAGLPILEVIKKKELQNVAVVVTRYFGGILLGAGGLVRAYGKACAGALENAGEIWIKPCLEIKIPIEYHLSGRLRNMLINEGFILGGIDYAQEVTFTVYLPKEQKPILEKHILDITGGVLRLEVIGTKNVKIDKDGKVID
ncbi:MAG: YigZ family protein [Clostridiaceae bacterium]|nr:YigZ family protein [Clostridiaceae bacterium]